MTRFLTLFLFVVAVTALAGCFSAEILGRTGPGGLAIGDKAPQVQIQALVHGKPMDAANAQGVQVIEFWATWCGPCLLGMPHLSELQANFGDEVTILGVTSEDLETVEGFLASAAGNGRTWADVVKYRLAVDDNGATNAAFMSAAGQNSIPTAFIIGKDGVLQWIGHPSAMDGPLKAVVDGTWQLPDAG
ncbi:MAG: TlpA disulfide reductase family protein [Rubripirellula sp.]|nr:TlpA disulfide reductase family protein [Rubripirellula sp.]